MVSIQFQQFLNLLFFSLLAYFLESFYLESRHVLTILLSTVIIEHVCIYIKYRKVTYFSFSSLSTAFGVMLMMASENIGLYVFAITLGLVQKHFLQLSGRHFFNPSNFALLMSMFFFYEHAHIVLGQLGDALYLRIIVIVLALIILFRAKRILIPIIFVLLYISMQYIFIVSYDNTLLLEDIYIRFYSVSFLLFLLFMLTDPHTTPSSLEGQIIFASVLALISVGLDRYYGFRVQHLFIALFLSSPFVSFIALYREKKLTTINIIAVALLIFIVLGVIISIENSPPYYFEMD